MVRKMSMIGEGVAFHVPAAKMKKVRVNLTPRQALVLRKGGAVTIKAITDNGSHEIMLPDVDVKKLLTKLQKGVGGRIKLNGGGIVEDFGRYVKPLSDRAIDRGIQALDGSGVFSDMMPPMKVDDRMRVRPAVMPQKGNLKYFTPEELVKYGYKGSGVGRLARDFGRYVKPLSDRAIDRGIQALDGSGMKKRGRPRKGKGILDMFNPKKNGAEQFFTKTLPNNLVDVGLPIAVGAVGSTIGSATGNPLLGMAGSYAGKQAGEAAARRIRKAQGRGVLTDLAMEVGKRVAKHVAKKAVSYAGKKARQGANYLVDRAEAGANDFIGEGIIPAGVGGGILPAGVNLRRGGALGANDAPIQTGVPYLQKGAPGWKPYSPSQNPFATNTMVMRQAKSGGRIVSI